MATPAPRFPAMHPARQFLLILIAILMALLWTSSGAAQTAASSHDDDLLDKLAGEWRLTGIVHGLQSRQSLKAEWVLNHQFLRIYEKSEENVAGQNFPFEGVYYVGYDKENARYVAHLLTVFGARQSEVLGHGELKANALELTFRDSAGAVVTRFEWQPSFRTWRIRSAVENGPAILELTATSK